MLLSVLLNILCSKLKFIEFHGQIITIATPLTKLYCFSPLFASFLDGDVDTSGDEDGDRRPSSSESAERPGSRDNEDSISDNGPQFKSPGTKPLDLTTKI